MGNKSGAIDLDECPYGGGEACRKMRKCEICSTCGLTKHVAAHGPFNGNNPGSHPYGHEFKNRTYSQKRGRPCEN